MEYFEPSWYWGVLTYRDRGPLIISNAENYSTSLNIGSDQYTRDVLLGYTVVLQANRTYRLSFASTNVISRLIT